MNSTATSPAPKSTPERYSTCTGLGCYGVEINGHVSRCPRCQSTLVTHHSRREPRTTAELDARASARAREQHVHIFAVPGRPGCYTTKSKSDPAERYTLAVRDGIEACSCRGFYYRASCKHVEALRNRLAREVCRRVVASSHADDNPEPEPPTAAPARVLTAAAA